MPMRVILVYEKRIIEVLGADSRQLLVPGNILTAEPLLPGFSTPVAELYPATA